MEANTFCACGCLAVRFCTCQKPRKVYLCNNCTNTHINKPGGHSFFDVKVNDLLDSDLYNSRTQCASQLRGKIDLICEIVQREQSCLGENINVLYEKHCHEIFQTYQKAWEEINAVYQELLSVLEKAKSEAGKLETDLKVELAFETRALLQLSWHGEKEVKTVLNTAEEAAKSLKLQPIKSAENVLATWSCGCSQCSTCGQKEKELVISSAARYCQQCHQQIPLGAQMCTYCAQGRAVPYLDLPTFKCIQNADGSVDCPRCSGAIPAGTVTCISCKFVMLRLVPDSIESVEEPPPPKPAEISMPTQHTWTCVACGYKYNLLEAMKCARCMTPKPRTQASQQAPNYAASPYSNYVASSYPNYAASPYPNYAVSPSPNYAAEPNPNECMCKCGSRQTKARCTNCGGRKAASTGIDMPSQPVPQSNPPFPAQPQSTQSQCPVFPDKELPSSVRRLKK